MTCSMLHSHPFALEKVGVDVLSSNAETQSLAESSRRTQMFECVPENSSMHV